MGTPFVSICIITGGNLAHLTSCLSSLSVQEDAPPFEVIVCANGCPDVEDAVLSVIPAAVVGRAERTLLGAARNPLIRRATGEWLLFLDDDVTINPRFLSDLQRLAADHPEAAVLGGPNTTPAGTPLFHVIQGAVLASMVVSGPVRRRYGPHPAGRADERFFTLCNLAVRRDAMISFPGDLIGAEENAVLAEMHRRGLEMHYDPNLAAFHERRPSLRSFAAQMFKYGLGRGQLARQAPATLRPAYTVPSALLMYLMAAAALAPLQPLVLAPLVVYLAAVAATALKIDWDLRHASSKHIAIIGTGACLAATVHLFYGLGFLRGLIVEAPDFAAAESQSVVFRPELEPTEIEALELNPTA